MDVSVLILAAGSGSRMGKDKMLLKLSGKSVIVHTIEKFYCCDKVDEIVVVASENNINIIKEETKFFTDKKLSVINGGKTRGESAVKGLKHAGGKYVLIHDGARPLVSRAIIENVIECTKRYGASAPGCKIKDTIKKAEDGFINETIDRDMLVGIQTPQGFIKEEIEKAYQLYGVLETDDCAIMEKAGAHIKIVDGSYENIKLTTPSDILMAEIILNKERSAFMRVGTGFDSHRLQENRRLIIGGVDIPYEKGLLGHSDADVLVHAIIDALLGAAALGDIGFHFPDSDEKYKGASSIELLKETARLISENGYRISNIDSTIIAQSPKMAPYIIKMRENIANAISIDISKVSVKAKTNEKMDAIGRGEGMEAHAVVIIEN